jgi:L-aspartate oxidase
LQADFLIVGSGIAALRAAAALEGAGDVLILTKSAPTAGNTGYAQGGIAAAVGPGDSPTRHMEDTLAAGDGLCDERAVAVLVEQGPRYVRELLEWGARFDRTADGTLDLTLEGAHSARRVLHARDATGREIGRALWERVAPMKRLTVHAHARAVDVIVEDGVCAGVRFLREDGTVDEARARRTLLATGGAGQVFSHTTNPEVATGDGIALAFRAGAAVADLEFVQFHPTALNVPGRPRFLLSEALRGEGARLINTNGDAFMARLDPAGDLAPRDRVARAISREMARTGRPVYLSLSHLDAGFVHQRFPEISAACRQAGLDLATDRIPVAPAAHYVMGGVITDVDGRTTIPGLFAAGEAACTGVHGANRLASNSLLEGLVFGARAGLAMRHRQIDTTAVETLAGFVPADPIAVPPAAADALDTMAVRETMWRHAGLFRDAAGLRSAVSALDAERARVSTTIEEGRTMPEAEWEHASLVSVGALIARAALRREESRGGHYRLDFPARDDGHWRRRVMEVRG